MIVSAAPGHILDRLRRAAGPHPEDSKLEEKERLHLIYMIGAVHQAGVMGLDAVQADLRATLYGALLERGLTADQVTTALGRHRRGGDVVAVVNAIAVHPDLRAHDYLD